MLPADEATAKSQLNGIRLAPNKITVFIDNKLPLLLLHLSLSIQQSNWLIDTLSKGLS
jgi:hypothetical protein